MFTQIKLLDAKNNSEVTYVLQTHPTNDGQHTGRRSVRRTRQLLRCFPVCIWSPSPCCKSCYLQVCNDHLNIWNIWPESSLTSGCPIQSWFLAETHARRWNVKLLGFNTEILLWQCGPIRHAAMIQTSTSKKLNSTYIACLSCTDQTNSYQPTCDAHRF